MRKVKNLININLLVLTIAILLCDQSQALAVTRAKKTALINTNSKIMSRAISQAKNDSTRKAAIDQYAKLIDSIFEKLMDTSLKGTPEQRARCAELLRELDYQTRLTRIMIKLPATQQKKLAEFNKTNPQKFKLILSSNPVERYKVLYEIIKSKDGKLAEPVIALCLAHPDDNTVKLALAALIKFKYTSPAISRALHNAWLKKGYTTDRARYSDFMVVHRKADSVMNDSFRKVLRADLNMLLISAAKSHKQPVFDFQILNHLMTKCPTHISGETTAVIGIIAAHKQLAILPRLFKYLEDAKGKIDKTKMVYSISADGKRRSIHNLDKVFLLICTLTNQDLKEYNFLEYKYRREWYPPFYTFATEESRIAAYKKILAWWKRNKHLNLYQRPYKKYLQSLKAGKLNSNSQASKFTPLTNTQLAETQANLESLTDYYISKLNSISFVKREKNHRKLRKLTMGLLKNLSTGISQNPSKISRAKTARMLCTLNAKARFFTYLLKQNKSKRDKIIAYYQQAPTVIPNAFSIIEYDRYVALRWLIAFDVNYVADDLLLYIVKSDTRKAEEKFLKKIIKGKYQSEEVVKFLFEQNLYIRNIVDGKNFGFKTSERYKEAFSNLKTDAGLVANWCIFKALVNREYSYSNHILRSIMENSNLKRLLPHLVEMLNDKTVVQNIRERYNHQPGKRKTITTEIQKRDAILSALILVTNQNLSDYHFFVRVSKFKYDNEVFTSKEQTNYFKNDEDRKKGHEKFAQWWHAYQKSSEFKKLKPVKNFNELEQEMDDILKALKNDINNTNPK